MLWRARCDFPKLGTAKLLYKLHSTIQANWLDQGLWSNDIRIFFTTVIYEKFPFDASNHAA